MSKIVTSLQQALAASKCEHRFAFVAPFRFGNGVVGRCRKCKCRFTAWPGTVHYDEIVAAGKEQAP